MPPKELAAWILMEEWSLLYNSDFYKRNKADIPTAKRIVVSTVAYIFSDGVVTGKELSVMTAWFNPNSGRAFDQGDADAFQTAPLYIEYARETVDEYWDQGPLIVDGHMVNAWWDSTETWCAGCKDVLKLYDPIKVDKYGNPIIYYFGYKP